MKQKALCLVLFFVVLTPAFAGKPEKAPASAPLPSGDRDPAGLSKTFDFTAEEGFSDGALDGNNGFAGSKKDGWQAVTENGSVISNQPWKYAVNIDSHAPSLKPGSTITATARVRAEGDLAADYETFFDFGFVGYQTGEPMKDLDCAGVALRVRPTGDVQLRTPSNEDEINPRVIVDGNFNDTYLVSVTVILGEDAESTVVEGSIQNETKVLSSGTGSYHGVSPEFFDDATTGSGVLPYFRTRDISPEKYTVVVEQFSFGFPVD